MADTHEMGNYPRVRDVKATTSQTHEVVAVTLDRDTLALARAGKKQVLKVGAVQGQEILILLELCGRPHANVYYTAIH